MNGSHKSDSDVFFEVITADSNLRSVEGQCDCACVAVFDSSFTKLLSPSSFNIAGLKEIGIEQLEIAPELYAQTLNTNYKMVFNLLDERGRAVLNNRTFQLLECFRNPIDLKSLLSIYGQKAREDIFRTTVNLLNLSFLQFRKAFDLPINETKLQAPNNKLVAWLHVTNQCNLRCPYCYLHKTADDMSLEVGQQSIDAIVRSARINQFDTVKLKFSGGEATLNLSLVEALHEYAEKKCKEHNIGLEAVILSNGVGIGLKLIEFLKKKNTHLMISIDGLGEYHDRNRPFVNGRGSFEHVMRSVNRLIQHGVKPDISVTISKHNLKGLPELVEFLLEREFPFNLNFYRENECSAQIDELQYSNQMIINALQKVFKILEKNIPSKSLLNAFTDRASFGNSHNYACGVGQNYLVVNQNGGIAKCQMEIEKPITSIYEKNPLAIIREDQTGIQNLPVEQKAGCKDCSWRYWCAGGCSLLTYRVVGRWDVKSPNCEIYKSVFPAILRLEGLRLLKFGKNSN